MKEKATHSSSRALLLSFTHLSLQGETNDTDLGPRSAGRCTQLRRAAPAGPGNPAEPAAAREQWQAGPRQATPDTPALPPPRCSQPMGGLSPPAAMATRRRLCGAQHRCHMSQDECAGGGERAEWGGGDAFGVKWSQQRE